MRKQWLLFLFLTMQCIARGQTAGEVTGYNCRLLVDGELLEQTALTPGGGKVTWDADASAFSPGLHRVTAQVVRHELGSSTTMQYESLFYRVAGNALTAHQVEGFCYIDGNLYKQDVLNVDGGVAQWNIDVEALPIGLHRVNVKTIDRYATNSRTDSYESFFYRVAYGTEHIAHELDAKVYVDGNLFKQEPLSVDGGVTRLMLDLEGIPFGLHTVKVIMTDKTSQGTATSCYDSFFYHQAASQPISHNLQGYCYVDDELVKQEALTVDGGKVQWNLDMSALPVGLHRINVKVIDENEAATAESYNSFFYRIPATSDVKGITGYDYWVNQDHQGHNDVKPYQEIYFLDTVLTVTEQEIRSMSFHFAVEDDVPVVYAQNDLWVMFHDVSGKEANAFASYTDIRTRREVTGAILLQPGETASMTRPAENEIKWYKVEALAGDSLLFKTDKACTWQLFSPTGKELYRADGDSATEWGGTFTLEDGIHYIAIHDMSVTGNTLSISYHHVDGQFVLDENDWEILKSFYAQYGNDCFVWDLTDRINVRDLDGVSIAIGRVVSIELPNKNLQGSFPAMLFGLEQLRLLDLSHNSLSGDAAVEIAQYASGQDVFDGNLQELNVSYNDFVGNLGELAALLPSLTALNAVGNHFSDVSPAIKQTVSLNLNDQRLTIDADLTRGMHDVIASIPAICYYDHRNQTQSGSLSVELVDETQEPQWTLDLSLTGDEYWMNALYPYRGANGQAITGQTSFSSGSWNNHQLLSGLFSFAAGDANLTGDVDVTDLQAMVNYIFSEYSRPFNFSAANHHLDAILNVQDVVGEVGILLAQNPMETVNASMRSPMREDAASASLYWSNGTLYIENSVPVASIDIVNAVSGNIRWLVDDLGMIVSSARVDGGEHAVIYSLGDAVIQPGVTAIAKTSSTNPSVSAAKLSDEEAVLVPVVFNNATDGITSLVVEPLRLSLDGGMLNICCNTELYDVDVTIYSIDGRIILDQHLESLQTGTTAINLLDRVEDNGYYIVTMRAAGQVIAIQKLTQTR